MQDLTRRQWLASLASAAAPAQDRRAITLPEYEPRSMLHVPETRIERARHAVIDFHTHLSWSGGGKPRHNATPSEVLPVMDRKNIRMMVNLTGGYGAALEETIATWHKPHPSRFLVFTQPWYAKLEEPDYPKFQADEIARARRAGSRGIKVLKSLGLTIRGKNGALVKIDDQRFDPMWEQAGALGLPIAIHSSDPEAFFLPIDRFNERYEELHAHPDWSFHGKDFPSDRELQEARLRVIARHPRTQFVCLHVANSENLTYTSECMDRHKNMLVEIGARIGELGRQPRASRRFFDRYQDRILFGTDAVPKGVETPQQIFNEKLYEIYYRFLETEDEYFDYAPWHIPPQGRWRIYGIGLPGAILRKVYWSNAARLLKVA